MLSESFFPLNYYSHPLHFSRSFPNSLHIPQSAIPSTQKKVKSNKIYELPFNLPREKFQASQIIYETRRIVIKSKQLTWSSLPRMEFFQLVKIFRRAENFELLSARHSNVL